MANKKEYVEKETLINIMINGLFPDKQLETEFDVIRAIEQTPTADVVEVVRCKNCRSWEEGGVDPITNYIFGYCRHYQWQDADESRETNGQDFCNYGERKPQKEEAVKCKDCEYLMFSDSYGECSKAYKGIVSPDDSCGKGQRKRQKEV